MEELLGEVQKVCVGERKKNKNKKQRLCYSQAG
jgi:hypothetical protein